MASLIILGSLWTYPIVAYFVIRLTRKYVKFRKYIFFVTIAASLVTVASLLTNISTTVSELDWLFLTSFYFLTCLSFWLTQFQPNKILGWIGGIAMVLVFAAGYLSGSIGALGIAFVTAEFETDREKWLGGGLVIKEQTLGNAISDHRGKRVEVYKTIKWFPVLEWKLQQKKYNSIITYSNPLTVEYKASENIIYLSTSMVWGPDRKLYRWADTLQLKN